ncbi:nuclear transport factor 2 family protein [Nonomuraea sp. NPDC050153]|uniref:nuclear transport factor 2 family protein n=1 Tax=Nonomuraea sp. NPDC050153 TaxID=3364359 RepID=UPI0037B4A51A
MSDRIGIEDRLAIVETINRYALTFDASDVDGFVDVFTSDGVFEAVLVGGDEPLMTLRGAADLRGFVERGVPGGGIAVHHVAGVVFDVLDRDEPRTRATVIVTAQLAKGPAVVTHGWYHDRWRETDRGWRIAHRRYVSAGYPPAPRATREG